METLSRHSHHRRGGRARLRVEQLVRLRDDREDAARRSCATLNQAFVAVVNQPDVRKILVAQGNDVIANTPEEFARVIQADAEKWGGIGRKLGIKLN